MSYNPEDPSNSPGSYVDAHDLSDDLEVCSGGRGWVDPDLEPSACQVVDGKQAGGSSRSTRWMYESNDPSPVCGLEEIGSGSDCDDSEGSKVAGFEGFCCGDDLNEFTKPGFECGTDLNCVCFAGLEDCYNNSRYYQNRESSCLPEDPDSVNLGMCIDGDYVAEADYSEALCDCIIGEGNWGLGGEDCDPDTAGTQGGRCCGDDPGFEYKLFRGQDYPDNLDEACCNDEHACVLEAECYSPYDSEHPEEYQDSFAELSPHTKYSLDHSDDLEVCILGNWKDPDSSQAACLAVDGKPVNRVPRKALWMEKRDEQDPVCGLGLVGESCSDSVNPVPNAFCCGDDKNETLKEETDNVCFKNPEDCYWKGDYYLEGSYKGDTYCEKGEITSRTKLIGLQLLDLAESLHISEYTLFCDNYSNTLNYYDYSIVYGEFSRHLLDYISKEKVNNFCILKLPGNHVIFGTSLNQPIDQGTHMFLDVLRWAVKTEVDCNDAIGSEENRFIKCSSPRVWYNDQIQGVIFSNEDINLGTLDFWGRFLFFLRNPFQDIFNFLLGQFEKKGVNPSDYQFISSTKEFSRIYIDRKGDHGEKAIDGVTEKLKGPTTGQHLSVRYSCYSADICKAVNISYSHLRMPWLGSKEITFCGRDLAKGEYHVSTNLSLGQELWPQLTSMLRPSSDFIPNTGVFGSIDAPEKAVINLPITLVAEVGGCNRPLNYKWTDQTPDPDKEMGDTRVISGWSFSEPGIHTIALDVWDSDVDLGIDEKDDGFQDSVEIDVISPTDCVVKDGACSLGESHPIYLSDLRDAHATKSPASDFNYNLCCSGLLEVDSESCEAGVFIFSGSSDTHISYYQEGHFEDPLCFKSPIDGLVAICRAVDGGDTCDPEAGEMCIASLSGLEDAHISDCSDENFKVRVCCQLAASAPERCDTPVDEDNDGDIGCEDSDCKDGDFCNPERTKACDSGQCICLDKDDDGYTDEECEGAEDTDCDDTKPSINP
ncbi:hypothetical protein KY358_06160, partial [Candidatus Woesearchaeota archaeon]|nr:hypothetical protein [Candidatus Woesearchaeota archaeon]